MITVHFEDHGQDFLEWDIENGEVIACRPFQEWLWKGVHVLNDTFHPGDIVHIITKGNQPNTVKYPIESVEDQDGNVID